MKSPASVNIARLLYLLICELAGVALALSTKGSNFEVSVSRGLIGGLIVAAFFMFVERLIKQFTLRGYSTATFGLLVGIFCAWLLTRVGFDELLASGFAKDEDIAAFAKLAFHTALFASLGFLGAVLALRSNRDDFAFVIPYMRFRRDDRSDQPVMLDLTAVTDARTPSLIASGFVGTNIVIPRFILSDLRELTEHHDQSEKTRGDRGMRILDDIRLTPNVNFSVTDTERPPDEETEEQRLFRTIKLVDTKLLTTDSNTARSARLQKIKALDVNELATALQQEVMIGSKVKLHLVRTGKDEHQAIGYLPDGAMIVVNNAVKKIGTTQEVTVVSKINTQAGVMIFADLS